MEQEKFVKLNQPSNPNMPRDTVETLKQIQKQGLSISIVGSSTSPFSLPSPATPDSRPKQSVLTVDKPSKILPRLASAENKTQVLQPRLISPPETRVSAPRIAPQPTFHDSKAVGNQIRANLPPVSEAKSFSSNWNCPNSSADSKVQGSVNRAVVATPVSKMISTPARLGQLLMTENKTPVNRINQSTLPENKNPARISQGQRVTPGQQLIEGKLQSNQDRVNNPSSPPDAKVFQVRTGQQMQRIVAQKGADGKITNQIGSNKQIEIKNTPNRVISGAKVLPESSQKNRSNYIVKTEGKISINSPMITENKMINSVRMVTSVSDSSASRTPQGKMSSAVMRLHPNVSGVETPTTVHSKMIQSVPVQSENKMILQGKVAISPSDMAQKSVPTFDALSDNSLGSPLTKRTIASKRAAAGLSPAKKKCNKRVVASSADLGAKNISASENNLNLSDDGNESEDKIFNSIKSNRLMPTGLTITPVGPSAASTPISTSNSSSSRIQGDLLDKESFRVVCPSCNNYSSNPKFCLVCKCNLSTSIQGSQQSTEVVKKLPGAQYVVTKNVTNVMVSKQIIIAPQDGMGRSHIQFGQTVQKKILIKTSPMMTSPRSKARPRIRRRYVEPVCLTLSSDDEEEHMQASFGLDEGLSQSQVFPNESEEGSKSGQSSPVYQDEEDNQELDDPQFPGVTDIHPMQGEEKVHYEEEDEEDEEEEDKEEMDEMEIEEEEEGIREEEDEEEIDESEIEDEEEEEVPPEEEVEEEQIPIPNKAPVEIPGCEDPLRCRSIRIGSFKVHPKPNNTYLNIYLATDGISFNAPMVTDSNKILSITLKPCDITQMYVHFGRCLPIVFIFTTPSFADSLRKSLNMSAGDFPYFDPNSNDEKEKKITFLIDLIVEEQRRFLRHGFLNDLKVRELDQKTANEILVKSTPNQNQFVRCEIAPQPFQAPTESQLSITPVQPQAPTAQAVTVKVTPAPIQPVLKLFTYPPPPQTGGIAVTNEDLACLNEGEFLNDAIIDFYLKYVFYEKLSEYHRDKTHIFSSYFFHRLTHKPERCRSGDEAQKTVAVRRHSQVKTWTRHVDIFSKDFIIIPVNQNVHWFLAIICYPGLVPEASESPPKDFKNNKSSDNVTSTDDQEENNKSASKEPNSTIDGNNHNSDENSTASSNNSAFEPEEPDSEEPLPEAPDSSTHPDKNRRRKEAPCICIFDSLNGPNRSRIATMLREYLDIEWKIRKGTRKIFDKNTMQGFIMQVPQQTNYSDCGIYLLQYVESFFENPLPYFDNPIPNLSNWFPKETVGKKRQELTDLILGLQKKQAPNTAIRKTNATENSSSSPAHTLQTENR